MDKFKVNWVGKKGQQVPVFETETTNPLIRIVPLSLEGGGRLSEFVRAIQCHNELVEVLTSLLIWDDGNLPGDLIDAARKAVGKTQGEEN